MYDDGSSGAEVVKGNAKKPARGRKPKVKSQTTTVNATSDDAGSGTAARKPSRKPSAKKAKKSRPSKIKDTSGDAAKENADTDSRATNRAPASSAPQDVIDVGIFAPDARKRGWWSRGE